MSDQSRADNRAVSPVVGVILLVALTVILSATIGTFVLDLGEDQNDPAIIGVAFEETERSGVQVVEATVVDVGNTEKIDVTYDKSPSAGGGTARNDTVFDGSPEVGDTYVMCEETDADMGPSFCDNPEPAADQGSLTIIGKNVDTNAISRASYT